MRSFILPISLFLLIAGCSGKTDVSNTVVATAMPEATDAAVEILKHGGNAMDAAVAASFALAVCEPAGSGLGGQVVIMVKKPGQEPVVIDGSSFAPMRTPPGIVSRQQLAGARRTTVPVMVKTIAYAHEKYGNHTVTWKEALTPAIRIANDGYRLKRFGKAVIERSIEELRNDSSAARIFLTREGGAPARGTRIKQPKLGATIRKIANEGPGVFYSGEMADRIAADIQARGGWLTVEDLYSVKNPVERPAIFTKYRDLVVYTTPPPYGGWAMLMMLNVLEQLLPDPANTPEPHYLAAMAQSLRIGQRSLKKNPVRNVDDYLIDIASKINKQNAEMLIRSELHSRRGETTHFTIVDSDGMVVSVSQSINGYFGAGIMHPSLGFFYNDYMNEFALGEPSHPYALRAGAKPYSSMSPTIAALKGEAMLALGSPGDTRILTSIVQVISNWKDRGMELKHAVNEVRMHVDFDSTLTAEQAERLTGISDTLESIGFRFATAPGLGGKKRLSAFFGGVQAICRKDDGWIGASDPRRDGKVAEFNK